MAGGAQPSFHKEHELNTIVNNERGNLRSFFRRANRSGIEDSELQRAWGRLKGAKGNIDQIWDVWWGDSGTGNELLLQKM